MPSLNTSVEQSPIGNIPADYQQIKELCQSASIGYTDEKTQSGDTYRNWYIVPDSKPAFRKDGTQAGRGTTNHKKFCMLLDFLRHNNARQSKTQLYDLAIRQAKISPLMKMKWSDFHNQMAQEGIANYGILESKASKKARNNKDFDLFDS